MQANARLTNGSYALNATDQVATQVLLSDPSPAGGTYVTFTYSTNGVASVSPNPAFIPTGQLAANIVITATSAGNTSITPTATGVNGTASNMTVSAANLFMPSSLRLGAGQTEANAVYVQVPQYLSSPLTVTFTSADTTVATVQPSLTIPAGTYYQYFPIVARAPGLVNIIATAPGWRPDTVSVLVTSPMVVTCCNSNFTSTAAQSTITVYAADSTRNTHYRVNSLAVRISSTDTTIMKVIDTLVTIPAGSYYTTARIIPAGTGGVAYVKATASGHAPDSSRYTITGPSFSLSWSTLRLGAGQEQQNLYIQIPNPVASPVTVNIANTDTVASSIGTSTIIIPAGTYYTYFTVLGKSPGVSTYTATATGYSPASANVVVTTPKLRFSGGSSVPAYSTSSVSVYSADTTNNVHNRTTPLGVTIRSGDTTILKIDTTGVIQPQTYYLQASAQVTGVSPGTVWIYASAPGHLPDSVQWTVTPAKLNLSWTTYNIGARQMRQPTDFYVTTPANVLAPVTVTLTQKQPSKVALSSSSLVIPTGQYYQYFGFSGLVTGVDTIIASAPGYVPDTGFVRVTTAKLLTGGLPSSATTTSPPTTVTIYAADSLGSTHYTMDTVTVLATSSDTTVIRPTQKYFQIIKGAYYAQPQIQFVGVGTATMTYSDTLSGYRPVTTNAVTVTGPTLTIAGGNGMLGMRQRTFHGSYYVYTPNNVGTPLTVNLLSTSTRVASVPASVTIPAGSNYAYFEITALDTIGTIQVQAAATGYSGAFVNMQVTQPKFQVSTSTSLNTTSQPTTVYVYATDANGTSHETMENVTVTIGSSATGVASLDSLTVQIDSGTYYTTRPAHWAPGVAGTAQITATDTRSAYYRYTAGTANVTVNTPTPYMSFNGLTLGLGQYSDEYISLPDYRTTALTIALGHAAVPRTNTPPSVTIPVNNYYQYFRIVGSSVGNDTISIAPTGHNPAKATVIVSNGRVDPIGGWPASVKAGDSVQVTIYARDVNQTVHYVSAATTYTLAPNANVKFVSGGANSTTITSVTIPADQTQVSFWLKGVSAGNGSSVFTATGYTTYTGFLTVTP